MRKRGIIRLAGGAIIAAGLLAAGSLAALAEDQKTGGSVTYANVSGPGTLDPYVSSSMVELEVIHHIYEGLVALDGKYNAIPELASHIDASPDGKTFTFQLRHGVKFQNGKELTSADVLASFERYHRISPNKTALDDVQGYETPDPYTFIVHLNHTNAVFIDVLKSPVYPFVIMPAEEKDKAPREADVIGTGPFKLGEWVKDSHLVIDRFDGYVPNDNYKGPDGLGGRKTAYLDSVRYNFVPEVNARIAALQSGGADVIASVSADLVGRLADRKDISVLKIFPYCQHYFILNTQQSPTTDPLIRQAVAATVNVDDIMAAISVATRRNHSMVYDFSPYYGGDEMKPYYDQHNVAKAKELLAKAGYKGEKLVLQTNSNYEFMHDSILVLAEQLKAAGINAEVQMVDWTTNAANMQEGKGGWNISTTAFCSNPLLGPQQWKFMIYGFPHVKGDTALDAAYAKFYASTDIADRKAAWLDIEKRVLEQAYMIKVDDQGDIRAYNNKLDGFQAYYMVHFWNVSLK